MTPEELDEIKRLMAELKKEVVDELSDKIQDIIDSQDDVDPYKTLQKYSREALQQIKKDLVNAIENQQGYKQSEKKIREAHKKSEQVDKILDQVMGMIEKIKREDETRIEFDNPLYPTKKSRGFIPAFLRRERYERGARNWIGLLFTGIGLTVMARGIWDASAELLSIQGSIILGGLILGLTAWLERRKVFGLFGQD